MQPLAAAVVATWVVVSIAFVCYFSIAEGDRRAATIWIIAGVVLASLAANFWRIFILARRAYKAERSEANRRVA